jgi:DNA-binding SARP family transcriptional activator
MTLDAPRLHLLGEWHVVINEEPVELPVSAGTLLALLALRGPLERWKLTGILRPYSAQDAASACLRTVLWKLGDLRRLLLDVNRHTIALAPGVTTDLAEVRAAASAVLEEGMIDVDPSWFSADLLPDWHYDWVLVERARHRQRRLHALEALAEGLAAAGRYADAVDAGMLAVEADPLRESAHRVVIAAHVAEGNLAEAVRQVEVCRRELRETMGLGPSVLLQELARGLLATPDLPSSR